VEDAHLGTLARQGEAWTLTFTRRFSHPPEKVWRAVTEDEHLAAWFPQQIVGERRPGSPLRFVNADGDGFEDEMVDFDPPSRMELKWGTDRLRIELHPDGDATLLTLTDTFTELGKAARDAAGWHVCLDRLVSHLGGEQLDMEGRWHEVHALYEDRFGPEASTIGPPVGSEDTA
jgi:uncharacterized protein YndB with AHSA1/START domain